MNLDSDFGYGQLKEIPLFNRNSISILIGAGFSAPKGYPIGNEINHGLQYFDDNICFSPDGKLTTSRDNPKDHPQINENLNVHQKYFIFCKQLIKEYTKVHYNEFDYELFYDFIKSDEAKELRYRALCEDLLGEFENFENYLFNISHIYNKMLLHLLKDKDGQSYYNDNLRPTHTEKYDGFLETLSQMSKNILINVHTLNHDLLFESFNKIGAISGKISDGFDEFGSEYFGKLEHNEATYHCRLKRYTGRYNTPIRLYKLHGSIDYVPFYRSNSNGFIKPEKYVKVLWGMGAEDIMKSRKSKNGYDESPFEYHPDFLTGTTSKIQRYNEPLLFKKLLKKFKHNLQQADKLIIIGYGCKDRKINEMIKEYFDYTRKPIFIIDKYASDGSAVFKFSESINTKPLKVDINSITMNLFD